MPAAKDASTAWYAAKDALARRARARLAARGAAKDASTAWDAAKDAFARPAPAATPSPAAPLARRAPAAPCRVNPLTAGAAARGGGYRGRQ